MFKSLIAILIVAVMAPHAFSAPAPGLLAGGLGLGHGAIIATAPATSYSVQKSVVAHPTTLIAAPAIATPVLAAAPVGIAIGHGGLGLKGIGLSGLSLGGYGFGLAGHGW